MDKVNLIEKLKTLKQWQLEQKLEFEDLQSEYLEYHNNSINSQSEPAQKEREENKENVHLGSKFSNVEASQNRMMFELSQRNFIDTLPANVLAHALRRADIGLDNNSNLTNYPGCTENDDSNSVHDNQKINTIDNKVIRTAGGKTNIDSNDYPGFNGLQASLTSENSNLTNWHMSGLETVIFKENKFIEDDITPIKSSMGHERSNYECSESEDGFSGSDQQEEMDGFKPLSETDDEEEICRRDKGYGNHSEMGETTKENRLSDIHEENFFVDANENTVIQMDLSGRKSSEDRPITPGIKGDKSFHELVEKEMSKEDLGQKQKKQTVVSSTPVKPKKRTFLKRGEGLRRFECGNYSKNRKNPNTKGKDGEGCEVGESKVYSTTGKSGNKSSSTTGKGEQKGFSRTGKTQTWGKKSSQPSKTASKSILKNNNNNNNFSNRNIPSNNYRKNDLSVINEEKETSNIAMKIINDRKAAVQENAIKMVEPDDSSRKVTFEKVIKREIIDDFSINASSFDVSFQNMLMHHKEKEERENKELDAFEALEEAAENVSLSSNSSVVIKYLGSRSQDEDSNYNQSSSKDEMPLIPENVVVCHDFDDETSWSDNSIISTGTDDNENDETILHEPNSSDDDENKEVNLSPAPKRIISKRKQNDNSNEHITQEVIPNDGQKSDKEKMEESYEKLPLDLIYSSNTISDTVKKKVAELEKEIEKFRNENNKLSELRIQREKDVKQLRREVETFQKEKTEELQRIEEYRNEEMQKVKNERKLFDKYQKEIKAMPNKQEREEIKELKAEVNKLKEELKGKEVKFNAASQRFRTRIVELETENKELHDELNVLERQRLQRWKTAETTSKPPETTIKNNVATVNRVNAAHATHPINAAPSTPSLPPEKYAGSGDEIDATRKENKKPAVDHFYLPGNIGNNKNEDSKRKEIRHPDGKIEVILPDSSRFITFPNGTKKTISKDEKTITVEFFNGDIKKILPNNKLVYYYAESRTTHTTFPDGQEMLEFPNNQVEKRYPDGKTEVIFPDHTVKYIYTDGSDETIFADGTVQKVSAQGVRTITFANGQREIHTKEYKRREYPNGTVKTVYEDGRQETKYSTGRLRVKDRDGNLIMDSGPK